MLLDQNRDITLLSGFKTKAVAKYYFEINTLENVFDLSEIHHFAKENNLPILFIGKGTNLLFAFDEYPGIVIVNNYKGWEFDENRQILVAHSGELVSSIANKLKEDYHTNIWERFIGLPGTIGALIVGNAGCFGLEGQHNFLAAEVYNLETGKIEILDKEQMGFVYRSSSLKEKTTYFVMSVTFDLSKIEEKYHSDINLNEFRQKQPKGRNCGSFFKNPSKENPAGKLIEEVGLKGVNMNGAFFSEKHANFLMSDGTATYKDLLNLVDLATKKVKEEKGFDLVAEVRIVGQH